MHPILVTTTCDDRSIAEDIGRAALVKRLAGCVQVSGPVDSMYWWQDEISLDQEYRIDLKSEKSLFSELCQVITSVHPYDVPEIIAVDISGIGDDYARWLKNELDLLES
jgi:periplasmic divalent cation tolerance protein